jgi:hypothetical protein
MASTTLVFAFAYMVLGIAGFVSTGLTHKTALIPCVFGALFFVLGILARKDHLRKHVMHATVLIALLAFVATVKALGYLPDLIHGTAERPAAVITQSINAGLSLLYIVFAVRSFIQARRARSS